MGLALQTLSGSHKEAFGGVSGSTKEARGIVQNSMMCGQDGAYISSDGLCFARAENVGAGVVK